jgi:hypothetical protein
MHRRIRVVSSPVLGRYLAASAMGAAGRQFLTGPSLDVSRLEKTDMTIARIISSALKAQRPEVADGRWAPCRRAL